MDLLREAPYPGHGTGLGSDAIDAPFERRKLRRPAVVLAGASDDLLQLPTLVALSTQAGLAARARAQPLPAGKPRDVLAAALHTLGASELPLEGMGAEAALVRVAETLFEHGLDLAHPHVAAHLQPPPLAVAVAADALASLSNASLDTYDSGPSGIALERWLIGVLTRLARLGPRSDGVLTPGGSLSNLLALLLARDAAALRARIDARRAGVRALEAPLVLCSELAHFSTHRACAALGLGEDAVCTVPTDARRRMMPGALAEVLERTKGKNTPIAIVATAGTTDFGSIDPLPELAEIAARHGVWLHVDAAYGFGALFSERLASRMHGIERADSITLDLHKLGWQPAAASVLLVANTDHFAALEREVAYLNPGDDAQAGLEGLLGRSLQTTRRPDAAKVVASLLAHGRRGLGDMVDACHELARYAERRVREHEELELVAPAELTTVVFRVRMRAQLGGAAADAIHGAARRLLFERGHALIGRTLARPAPGEEPRVCLKFTLLNPTATPDHIDALIDAVVCAAREAERMHEERYP